MITSEPKSMISDSLLSIVDILSLCLVAKESYLVYLSELQQELVHLRHNCVKARFIRAELRQNHIAFFRKNIIDMRTHSVIQGIASENMTLAKKLIAEEEQISLPMINWIVDQRRTDYRRTWTELYFQSRNISNKNGGRSEWR